VRVKDQHLLKRLLRSALQNHHLTLAEGELGPTEVTLWIFFNNSAKFNVSSTQQKRGQMPEFYFPLVKLPEFVALVNSVYPDISSPPLAKRAQRSKSAFGQKKGPSPMQHPLTRTFVFKAWQRPSTTVEGISEKFHDCGILD